MRILTKCNICGSKHLVDLDIQKVRKDYVTSKQSIVELIESFYRGFDDEFDHAVKDISGVIARSGHVKVRKNKKKS
jgi:hypothetical protein